MLIAKNGCGDLVIMSMEAYKEMLETAAADTAIAEVEAEYTRDGKLHDARQSLCLPLPNGRVFFSALMTTS